MPATSTSSSPTRFPRHRVLFVLPLQPQVVPLRSRVSESATGQAIGGLRGSRQRRPHVRDPVAMQVVAGEINASRIDALFRRWLARLPYPFSRGVRARGTCRSFRRSVLSLRCSTLLCTAGVTAFDAPSQPVVVDERRSFALRFGDPRIQAVLAATLPYGFLPNGLQRPPDEGGGDTASPHRRRWLTPSHL